MAPPDQFPHPHEPHRLVLDRRCTAVKERPTHIGPWPLKPCSDSDSASDRRAKLESRPPIEKRHSVAEVLKSVDEQCRHIEALMRWDNEQKEMTMSFDEQRGCVSAPVTPSCQSEPFWKTVFFEQSFQAEIHESRQRSDGGNGGSR